jgi:hypothetical protein
MELDSNMEYLKVLFPAFHLSYPNGYVETEYGIDIIGTTIWSDSIVVIHIEVFLKRKRKPKFFRKSSCTDDA